MKKIWLFIPILLFFQGCYSFKGLTIDCSKTKTFAIVPFGNNAPSAPPTINVDFGEFLRDKILRETCLSSTTADGDVSFSGEIFKYAVTSVAPTAEQTSVMNRLTIGIAIDFVNTKNEKESYQKRYEWYEDYDGNENLLNIQTQLIATISEQILENIFNDAFTNW